jgi:hypothetical protein
MDQIGHEIAQSLQSSRMADPNQTPSSTKITSTTAGTHSFGASRDASSIAGTSSSSLVDDVNILMEFQRNQAQLEQMLQEKERQQQEFWQQQLEILHQRKDKERQRKQRRRKCFLVLLVVSILTGSAIASGLVMGRKGKQPVNAPIAAPTATPTALDVL